ncbi:lipopolysaccharide biosynthesis protein [Virgibacillus ainsalahensis]
MSKIQKAFAYTFFSNASYAVVQWILLVIITKFGTANDVGNFTYALSLTAPIIMLASLKYDGYIKTHSFDDNQRRIFIVFRVIISILSTVLFIPFIYYLESNILLVIIVFIVLLYKTIESMTQLKYSFLIQENNIDYMNKSKIRRTLLVIIFVPITFIITESLLLFVLINLVMFTIDLLLIKKIKFKGYLINGISVIQKTNIKKYGINFIPFGLSLFLVSINANATRYLARAEFGVEEVGFVASLSYFIIVGNMVINSLYTVSSFSMRKQLDNHVEKFKGMFYKYLVLVILVGIIGVICAIVLGDEFLVYIYSINFSGMDNEFIIIMVTALFLYLSSYLQHILTFMNQLNIQMWAVLLGLALQITAFYLLKDMGTIAIYLAYMASAIGTAVILYITTIKQLKIRTR